MTAVNYACYCTVQIPSYKDAHALAILCACTQASAHTFDQFAEASSHSVSTIMPTVIGSEMEISEADEQLCKYFVEFVGERSGF